MSKSPKDKEKQRINQEEDLALVNDVLNGKEHSFGVLQNKYKKLLGSAIRKMVKDEDDIDDLVQESFIKAFRALNSYQSNFLFASWIYRIASNTCIDFLRKKRFATFSIDKPISNSDDDLSFEIEDNSFHPEFDILSSERKTILNNAIEELPDNYREIIKLRHDEDLDYKEISERLQMPLGTVKAHLFRARKILLERLKNQTHLFLEN